MIVKILPAQNPPAKLADVELWFEEGLLSGLRLTGFAIWQNRTTGDRHITFPARTYSIRGERRAFALLRPVNDMAPVDALSRLILTAYDEFAQHVIEPVVK